MLPRNRSLLLLLLGCVWQVADGLLPTLSSTATCVHFPPSFARDQTTVLYVSSSVGNGSKNQRKKVASLRRNGDIKIEGLETKFSKKSKKGLHKRSPEKKLCTKTEKLLDTYEAGKMTGKQIHEATELLFTLSKTRHHDQCIPSLEKILWTLIKENKLGNEQSRVTAEMYYAVSTTGSTFKVF